MAHYPQGLKMGFYTKGAVAGKKIFRGGGIRIDNYSPLLARGQWEGVRARQRRLRSA